MSRRAPTASRRLSGCLEPRPTAMPLLWRLVLPEPPPLSQDLLPLASQLKRELSDKKALPDLPPKQPLSRVSENNKLIDEVSARLRRAKFVTFC